MSTMRSTLRLAGHYFRFNLSAGMAYRAAFLTQVFGMVLNNSMFIIFWLILFEQVGGNIKGYGLEDVMFLWSLAASGFGIAQVFMGNGRHVSRIIYSGELDVYLLQPKPVVVNLVASRMVVSGWGDLVYGIVLFFVTQPLTIYTVGLFILFSVLMALVVTALRLAYHSLTFFLGNAESLANLATEMIISFMIYPGSIFKGPTVWILHSIVPAALVAYIPARLIKSFDPIVFAVLLAADTVLITLALLAFRRGLKVYESGNRMGTRV
jgi:ABC-2 type transport system permease protein